MAKRILAFFLTAALLFSVLLFTSCKEEVKPEEHPAVTLTPKAKLLKTGENASNYFTGLTKALGIDLTMTPLTDEKMVSEKISLTISKLSSYDQSLIKEPLTISGESLLDFKNNAIKALVQFETQGEKVPVDVLLTSDAFYFGIDKVTERMQKVDFDNSFNLSLPTVGIIMPTIDYKAYINAFIDSFSDDLFTAQTGRVTVDGLEFDGETVTLTATFKQFSEAVIKLLEKSKSDFTENQSLLGFLSMGAAQYNNLIDSFIEDIKEYAEDSSDNDQLTITVINESNILRSFDFTITAEQRKLSVSITTTEKDGTYAVKGTLTVDDEKIMNLNYQQKPNDKNSADGELVIQFMELSSIGKATDEDKAGNVAGELRFKFDGQKSDNRFSANTKVEIVQTVSGAKVTIPLNTAFEYEKISDSEVKCSINLSLNAMNAEFEAALSGSIKIIDYAPIPVPSDSEVDEFDINDEKIPNKIEEVYPGIVDFIKSLSNPYEPTIDYQVYGTSDGSFSIQLYSRGYGYINLKLEDLKFADGKYSAKLPDGTKISGTYTQNGNNYTIDGEPFVLEETEEEQYLYKEYGPANDIVIFLSEDEYRLCVHFIYTLEEETLTLNLSTGAQKKLTFENDGNSYKINGVKVDEIH